MIAIALLITIAEATRQFSSCDPRVSVLCLPSFRPHLRLSPTRTRTPWRRGRPVFHHATWTAEDSPEEKEKDDDEGKPRRGRGQESEDAYLGVELPKGALPHGSLPMGTLAGGAVMVGEICRESSDCVQGAACVAGQCDCLISHVQIESYCWKRINPEQAGCTYDAQCDAVSPGARCVFSICRCSGNRAPTATREGPVCHPQGHCPTNGANALLYNRNSASLAQCFFFDGETDRRAGKFIGCDDFPEVYDCIDGLCCPTRALTCTQPMDPGEMDTRNGTQQPPLIRWFFNPVTFTCERFDYTGIGGNANNFVAKTHCESYCALRCPRGQPQLDSSQSESDPLASLAVVCSSDKGACDGERFSCTALHGSSQCCPTPAFICSEFGGLSEEMVELVSAQTSSAAAFSAGSNRQGQGSVTRWYWDRAERRCRSFRYFGQGGNFNNFLSEQHCLGFCTKSLCPLGGALRDTSGSTIECTASSQCPRSHTCHTGVCCPSAATICSQPLAQGTPCSAQTVQRFWFNAATRACQPFSYSGCDGNSNNFLNQNECEGFCTRIEEEPKCPVGEAMKLEDGKYWQCGGRQIASNSNRERRECPANFQCHYDGKNYGCCPTKEYTCRLSRDEGKSCGKSTTTRWFYDEAARSCRSFDFRGCDGNANNFETQRECVDFCAVSGCPNGGDLLRADGTGEATSCSRDSDCPTSHLCTVLLLPGQSSSSDRFCCPSRAHICVESMDVGFSCTEPERRYFFDQTLRACRPFTYRGCGGNANNFGTKLACNNVCLAAACAPSETSYQPSSSELPLDCSVKACPRGYLCVADPFSAERKVCCGAPNMGVCPSSQRPLLDYRNQKPRVCSSISSNDCPPKFRCSFNAERNEHFCCGEAAESHSCPSGARLIRDTATGGPIGCNSNGACPDGAACHRTDPFTTGVCCHNLDNVCPPLFKFERELSEGKECSPLTPRSCSASPKVVCLFSEKMDRFVCCKRDSVKTSNEVAQRCPANTVQDAKRIECSASLSCPPPFFCVRQNSERVGVCCKHPLAVLAGFEKGAKGAKVSSEEGKEGGRRPPSTRGKGTVKAPSKKKAERTKEDVVQFKLEKTRNPLYPRVTTTTSTASPTDSAEEYKEEGEEGEEAEGGEERGEEEEESPYPGPWTGPVPLPRAGRNKRPGTTTRRPTPSTTTPRTTTMTMSMTTRSTRPFSIDCGPFELPLLDATGRPTLCADAVPCPAPYQCRPSGSLSLCCGGPRAVAPIGAFPSSPPPSPVPLSALLPSTSSNANPYQPQPRGVGMPPNLNALMGMGGPHLPNPFPPRLPIEGYGMTTTTTTTPAPTTTTSTTPEPPVTRPAEEIEVEESALLSCPDGMVPFSTDGRAHSCSPSDNSCPPRYKCMRSACCPIKDLACREPLFRGTSCRGKRGQTMTRFFYDHSSKECRSFEFRGCNPGANHFLFMKSCERVCAPAEGEEEDEENEEEEEDEGGATMESIRGTTRKRGGGRGPSRTLPPSVRGIEQSMTTDERINALCPPPYVNPRETPQVCSPFFESCPGQQKCLPAKDQHYLCCATPSSTSLRSLIARMCGEGYKPVLSANGDPRRCDPSRLPCSRRHECRFSTVLMLDICCAPTDGDAFESRESVAASLAAIAAPTTTRIGGRGRGAVEIGGYPRGTGAYTRMRPTSMMEDFHFPRHAAWLASDAMPIRLCAPGEQGPHCLHRQSFPIL